MKNSKLTLNNRKNKRNNFKNNVDISLISKLKLVKCKDCLLLKEARFNFCFSAKGMPEYKTRCLLCQRKWESNYRKSRRSRFAYLAKIRKNAMKAKCVDYLGGKCSKCNYSKSYRALSFHHRSRDNKEYSISFILDRSWKLIKLELDKCELLCSNCHMEEEELYEIRRQNANINSNK